MLPRKIYLQWQRAQKIRARVEKRRESGKVTPHPEREIKSSVQ